MHIPASFIFAEVGTAVYIQPAVYVFTNTPSTWLAVYTGNFASF